MIDNINRITIPRVHYRHTLKLQQNFTVRVFCNSVRLRPQLLSLHYHLVANDLRKDLTIRDHDGTWQLTQDGMYTFMTSTPQVCWLEIRVADTEIHEVIRCIDEWWIPLEEDKTIGDQDIVTELDSDSWINGSLPFQTELDERATQS